jgi:hypothetical protein
MTLFENDCVRNNAESSNGFAGSGLIDDSTFVIFCKTKKYLPFLYTSKIELNVDTI